MFITLLLLRVYIYNIYILYKIVTYTIAGFCINTQNAFPFGETIFIKCFIQQKNAEILIIPYPIICHDCFS